MKDKKETMNKIIEQTEAQTFTLFYKLIKGNFKFEELTDEEKIISKCVKNECTDVQWACYNHYEEIKRTKNTEKILYL